MNNAWTRSGVYVLLVVAAAAAGYYTGKGQKEVHVVEKKGETVTQTITKVVTVEKIVHPDGTVEERTITRDEEKNKEKTVVDRRTETKPIPKNDYSLGLRYRVNSFQAVVAPGPQQVELEAGRRLLGDIWLTAGGGLGGVTLGVRYDF